LVFSQNYNFPLIFNDKLIAEQQQMVIFSEMKWIKAIFFNLWKLYVGLVFSLTAILLYPFFLIILALPNGRLKSFKLFVIWSRMMQIFCFYPSRKNKNIPKIDGPFIILPNHTSYLDIFLMCSLFPDKPFLFMGKSEILSYPILKTYFKKLNIPVDRSNKMKAGQAFIKAKQALEEGFSLVIFPEGGIPKNEATKLGNFKDGAFLLADKTGVPLIPIAFLNHHDLFSDPCDFFGSARPGLSHVYVHDPVYIVNSVQETKILCRALIQTSLEEAEKDK
jgi:1-acyl-sn-glycerol-3-phosphate acyltransferase